MTGRRYFEEKLAAQVEGELAREGRGHGDESLDEDDFDFASDDFDESGEEDDEILAFMRAGAGPKPSEAGEEEEEEEEEERRGGGRIGDRVGEGLGRGDLRGRRRRGGGESL